MKYILVVGGGGTCQEGGGCGYKRDPCDNGPL